MRIIYLMINLSQLLIFLACSNKESEPHNYSKEILPIMIKYGRESQILLEQRARSTKENIRPFLSAKEEINFIKKAGCKEVVLTQKEYFKGTFSFEFLKELPECKNMKIPYGLNYEFICKDKGVRFEIDDRCGKLKDISVYKGSTVCTSAFKNFIFGSRSYIISHDSVNLKNDFNFSIDKDCMVIHQPLFKQ